MTFTPRVPVGKPDGTRRWIGRLNMPAIFDDTSSRPRTWRVHASYPVGSTGWSAPRPTRSAAAKAAFALGLLYAAVSVYWALGGTWLLATVGGALQRQGRTAILVLAVWAAVVIKMVAAVLPLMALRRVTSSGWNRAVSLLAWIEAGILTVYGLVLTVVGMLVQAGITHQSAGADHRALAWHAYLWDPWFLIWGLLVAGALRRGRHHSQAQGHP
jgi:hypothetical protein